MQSKIYVSDTTAITNLAAIGRLDLMRSILGQVVIPREVYRELTRYGDRIPGAIETKTSNWIVVRDVRRRDLVASLIPPLDLGEAEAIALALEMKASVLVIDESAGRQAAKGLGLRIVGLVGLLIEAKRRQLIPFVAPLLDQLKRDAGFRLNPSLVAEVLTEVNE
jgi:predicted nucleic acid-binding protein